jgi:hypothetical protein
VPAAVAFDHAVPGRIRPAVDADNSHDFRSIKRPNQLGRGLSRL